MVIEGTVSQGKSVGRGELTFRIKDGTLLLGIKGNPRPRRKEEELPQPLEDTVEIPLHDGNVKALFHLAVEGRNSLIAKALKEGEEQEFDVKLQGGEGVYARFRGYRWGFTLLARKGGREAFLIMKPREFYPIARAAEKFSASRKKSSAVVSRDLDVLVGEAEKGVGLVFRTVDGWREVARIEEKPLLIGLVEDLTDRTRIEEMYPARFGPIGFTRKNSRSYLRVGGRNYSVGRKELLAVRLLAETAL